MIKNDVFDVVDYIIKFHNDRDVIITHLKLQKLLYFVQIYFLLQTGYRCFNNDLVAFDYGPVVIDVFKKYKGVGRQPLICDKNVVNLEGNNLIDDICDKFLKYSANELVDLTHGQKPYREAINKGYGSVITDKSILDYFTNIKIILNNL